MDDRSNQELMSALAEGGLLRGSAPILTGFVGVLQLRQASGGMRRLHGVFAGATT